jgi:hypothetical protein
MSGKPLPTELEEFRENLEENMLFLEEHLGHLEDAKDTIFADGLIKFFNKFERLSDKQLMWAHKFYKIVYEIQEQNDNPNVRIA